MTTYWSAIVIHVIAKLELVPGMRDDFLTMFHELVPQVLAEEGCIEYGPTKDCQSAFDWQIPMGDNVVTVMEKWDDVPALQAHLSAPHMEAFFAKANDMLVGISGHILEPA